MVDDYAGYKALFTQGITELGCLAHAWRKFFDLHAANLSPIAAAALQRIAALYAIEQAAAGRLQLRQTQAKPLLGELHDWLIQTRVKVADGSGSVRIRFWGLNTIGDVGQLGLLPDRQVRLPEFSGMSSSHLVCLPKSS